MRTKNGIIMSLGTVLVMMLLCPAAIADAERSDPLWAEITGSEPHICFWLQPCVMCGSYGGGMGPYFLGWYLDGNGPFGVSECWDLSVYPAPSWGIYSVTFKVFDGEGGGTVSDTEALWVLMPETYEPDSHGPYEGLPNEGITFTASADGGIPPYYLWWDYDGDDTFDTGPLGPYDPWDSIQTTHAYAAVGEYQAVLKVADRRNTEIDPDGYFAFDFADVSVLPVVSHSPEEVEVGIAPEGAVGCSLPEIESFIVTLTNRRDQEANFTVEADGDWIAPQSISGTIGVGGDSVEVIDFTLGPIADPEEQVYFYSTIDVHVDYPDLTTIDIDIPITAIVYCITKHITLSTACWQVDVWDVPRAGGNDEEGQMYWFLDQVAPMKDEGAIITYADDTCQTSFSIYNGSYTYASFVPFDSLETEQHETYDYARSIFATGDMVLVGEIEYYVPIHPDTCVLIERMTVCNDADTTVKIHIGEGIDWDIPDGDGTANNQCGKDQSRNMIYQCGPPGWPEENHYGGVSFCNDISGAIVLESDEWVYPNLGYEPCEIGGLLARHSGFVATDSIEDLSSVYIVEQNVALEPDSCVVYCKVKTSSLTGLADLQALIDKGKAWIRDHELDCPGCEAGPCDAEIGNANGSTAYPPIDIDDVVYLIAYMFSGGPAPTPYPSASGDANCSCTEPAVDIDDIVYLIEYMFSGGPAPCSCEEWVAICGDLH